MIYVELFSRHNLFVKCKTDVGSEFSSESILAGCLRQITFKPDLKMTQTSEQINQSWTWCDPKVGSCAKTLISLIGNLNCICVPRRRGQVPTPTEIPAAPNNLGRRGDRVLLQGEVQELAEGVLQTQPVPHTR